MQALPEQPRPPPVRPTLPRQGKAMLGLRASVPPAGVAVWGSGTQNTSVGLSHFRKPSKSTPGDSTQLPRGHPGVLRRALGRRGQVRNRTEVLLARLPEQGRGLQGPRA